MLNESKIFMRGFVAAQLVSVAALAGGCDTEPAITVTPGDPAMYRQMAVDSAYMMKAFQVNAGDAESSHQIDLADPGQYRFVMNRLAAAGKTSKNSPHLFERLDQLKLQAIERAKGGVVNATSTDWCTSFIQMGAQSKSGTQTKFANTAPFVSCLNGASYVYADVSSANATLSGSENFVVASAAGEDFSGGTNFGAVKISPAMPLGPGRVNKTDSLVIADDDLGNEQVTYNVTQTSLDVIAPAITLAHPIWHDWIQNNGYIQMCQLRSSTSQSQCDYGVGSLTGGAFTGWAANAAGNYTGIAAVKPGTGTATIPWAGDTNNYFSFATPTTFVATWPATLDHVYIPTEGTAETGTNGAGTTLCVIQSLISAKFRLIKAQTGGACTTIGSFTAGFPNPLPANAHALNFRTISDFVNNGGSGMYTDPNDPTQNKSCSQADLIQNNDVKASMTIIVKADCGAGPTTISMSTGPGGQPAVPQTVRFINSCLPEGTKIRRADGSSATVESLKAGDKVISDNKGTVLTVTETQHGIEGEPLVELKDNKGHHLQLTSTHPVIKASGDVVLASAIKEDDRVMTDRGVASITAVARVPYSGQVYNLALGTSDEVAKVGKQHTTMYAGGFLVGDSVMQRTYSEPQRREVARLSSAWQQDYENAVANNPPMVRVLK